MRPSVRILAGFVVVIAGVFFVTSALGNDDRADPSVEAAEVGRLICEGDGVLVRTPRVLASSDGLRLEVENIGKERRYQVRSLSEDSGQAAAGVLPADGSVDLLLPVAPGELAFECFKVGSGEALVGELELLDPGGLWTPVALACEDPESGLFETDYAEEPFVETARRALPGLQAGDTFVKPGYLDTLWHGELHVVVREGVNVARVVRVLNHGTWNVTVDACAGTGLTEGAIAETGAT